MEFNCFNEQTGTEMGLTGALNQADTEKNFKDDPTVNVIRIHI